MSQDRERQATAQVACPVCGVPAGTPCADAASGGRGRPFVHAERRRAWEAAKPSSDEADILMRDVAEGPPGQRHTYVLLEAKSARGRGALPAVGVQRLEHPEVRATLARLRERGLVVTRG